MEPRRVDGARSLGARASTTLVAVGNFDGVHVGHRAVIAQAVEEAEARGLAPLVLTFHPHPSEVLGRGRVQTLTTLDRKVELICRIHPSVRIVVEPFTLELSSKSPRDFAQELLVSALGARVVIVGENFRFGHKRAGDLAVLRELGKELGFEARPEPLLKNQDEVISSTRIRQAIVDGDIALAERLLGRPHAVSGEVGKGAGRGRTIGVPTANLQHVTELLPAYGVYACLIDEVTAAGAVTRLGTGVANIGLRPTLDAGFSVEAHVFDFAGDLYGRSLRLHLVERLREERRFAGIDELKAQIEKDIARARAAVATRRPDPGAGGAWY